LKKLVRGRVQVTKEDLEKGFEANYGPRVRCRAIVLANIRQAQKVWEMARANPTVEFFGELATQYSIEAGSKALQGQVPPIKRFGGQPLLEKEAFALKPGELSGIIQAGNQYVILLCEGFTEPIQVEPAAVRALWEQAIREKALRLAMAPYVAELQDNATIDNVLAGTSRGPNNAIPIRLPAGTPVPRNSARR